MEQVIIGALLAFARQAAVFVHCRPFGRRATTGAVKAWRAAVIGHVLELAEIGIQAAELGLVVIQGVHCGTQVVHRPGSLVPDIRGWAHGVLDRKSTRLNSSHVKISYAVFCLKKKKL